jgi:hypothetical protein
VANRVTLAAGGIRFVIATGYDREGIDPAYKGAPLVQKAYDLDELIEVTANILRP